MANLPTRNNNPGDLKNPSTGEFEQFNDPQSGFSALKKDLLGKMSGATSTGLNGQSSLRQLAYVWAPPSENDSESYTTHLSSKLGVSPETPIGSLTGRVDELADAIAGNEGFQGAPSHKYNVTQFAQKIRAKYPQYNNIDDKTLVNKVLIKYPQYQSVVDQSGGPSSADNQENPGFVSEVSGDISKRFGQAGKAFTDASTGEINPFSGVLQGAGAVAGSLTDVAGDVLKRVPGVSSLIGLAGKGIKKVAETETGQKVIGAAEDFSKAHPEISGDIGAAGNILGAYGVLSGAGQIKDAVASGIGKVAGKDALAGTMEDLTPGFKAGTKAGAKAVLKRGVGKSPVTGAISLGSDESARPIAQVIKDEIPNFDKLSTYTDKLNATDETIGKLATQLRTNLSGEAQPILSAEDLTNLAEQLKAQIAESPVLVGNAEQSALRVFNKFKSLLPTGRDITMNDVLDARQALDRWIEGQGRGRLLDPSVDSGMSAGLRAVRQGANDLIAQKVPEGDVRELLTKQSLLYRAMDRLAPKAAKEVGTHGLGRFALKHPVVTGLIKKGGKAVLAGAGLETAAHFFGD